MTAAGRRRCTRPSALRGVRPNFTEYPSSATARAARARVSESVVTTRICLITCANPLRQCSTCARNFVRYRDADRLLLPAPERVPQIGERFVGACASRKSRNVFRCVRHYLEQVDLLQQCLDCPGLRCEWIAQLALLAQCVDRQMAFAKYSQWFAHQELHRQISFPAGALQAQCLLGPLD